MSGLTIVNVAEELITEANDRFDFDMVMNQKHKESFMILCGALDKLKDDSNASEFNVSIDDEGDSITISIVCPYVESVGRDSPLMLAMRTALEFSCKQPEPTGDNFELKFKFPGIWDYKFKGLGE